MLCAFTSCLNPRMVNRWVATHYNGQVPPPAEKKNESITVVSTLPVIDEKLSSTKKDVSHLLPLIVYIQYDYKNICTLNPQIPVGNFTSTVRTYSGKGLKQKLNGNHLELTIEQMPNVMVVDDKGKMYLLLVGLEWLSVVPKPQDMVVSYRLLNPANEEIRKGVITIRDKNQGLSLGMFQSLKKLSWRYLDQYDANITSMSRNFVDRLTAEL